ncbi:MAG: hypothetical protein ACR2MQ_10190 [Gemmatimonadaceae bacterium]
MTDCVCLHLLPRVAAAVTVDSLRRDIALPLGYSVSGIEPGVSRKSSTAVPLVLLTVSVDGPDTTDRSDSTEQQDTAAQIAELEAAVMAAATSAYRRTLPTSADIPIYIKHSRGFAISRHGLDALRKAGLPDTFMNEFAADASDSKPFLLDDHLWFSDSVRAGLITRDEPTKADWRDIQRSLEAAESAMARLTRKRVERSY